MRTTRLADAAPLRHVWRSRCPPHKCGLLREIHIGGQAVPLQNFVGELGDQQVSTPFGGLTHFVGPVKLCFIARVPTAVNCIEELARSLAAMKATTSRLLIRRRHGSPGPPSPRVPPYRANPLRPASQATLGGPYKASLGVSRVMASRTPAHRTLTAVGQPVIEVTRPNREEVVLPCVLHIPQAVGAPVGATRHRVEWAPAHVSARARQPQSIARRTNALAPG